MRLLSLVNDWKLGLWSRLRRERNARSGAGGRSGGEHPVGITRLRIWMKRGRRILLRMLRGYGRRDGGEGLGRVRATAVLQDVRNNHDAGVLLRWLLLLLGLRSRRLRDLGSVRMR